MEATQTPQVIVDRTPLGRRVSGIARITAQLFYDEALASLRVKAVTSSRRRLSMIAQQTIGNLLLATVQSNTLWAFPGYPPSPLFCLMRSRLVFYVHDLFLMGRGRS
jgi:hypothetical protein